MGQSRSTSPTRQQIGIGGDLEAHPVRLASGGSRATAGTIPLIRAGSAGSESVNLRSSPQNRSMQLTRVQVAGLYDSSESDSDNDDEDAELYIMSDDDDEESSRFLESLYMKKVTENLDGTSRSNDGGGAGTSTVGSSSSHTSRRTSAPESTAAMMSTRAARASLVERSGGSSLRRGRSKSQLDEREVQAARNAASGSRAVQRQLRAAESFSMAVTQFGALNSHSRAALRRRPTTLLDAQGRLGGLSRESPATTIARLTKGSNFNAFRSLEQARALSRLPSARGAVLSQGTAISGHTDGYELLHDYGAARGP